MKKDQSFEPTRQENLTPPNLRLPDDAAPVPPPKFTHLQLMAALYWIWDAFDRCVMPFFLVYGTAEAVLQKKQLEGDAVHVGVRRLDWTSGSKPIFDAFAGLPYMEDKELSWYKYMDIPVYIHIFDNDECIQSTNTILYEREYFKLPNPYKRFMDKFGGTWKSP